MLEGFCHGNYSKMVSCSFVSLHNMNICCTYFRICTQKISIGYQKHTAGTLYILYEVHSMYIGTYIYYCIENFCRKRNSKICRCDNYLRAETNQGRKLFKGGNYSRKYGMYFLWSYQLLLILRIGTLDPKN